MALQHKPSAKQKTFSFSEKNCIYFTGLINCVNEDQRYLIILQNNNVLHVLQILFQAVSFKQRHRTPHCPFMSLKDDVYGFITTCIFYVHSCFLVESPYVN